MRSIADVEIKPKDADSMGEWLQSLSDDTLTKLQDMLRLSGQNAEGLAAILSSMSGADAINYITEAYKEYYGTIDDATQATNDITIGLIKKRLLKIIMTSSNENVVVKSCQVLYSMLPKMTLDILAEMVSNEEIAQERAEKFMEELGMKEEDLYND